MLNQEKIQDELNHLRNRVESLELSMNKNSATLIKKWYSPQEAADYLSISKALVLRMADAGQLEYWKSIGGHRKIYRESLESHSKPSNMGNTSLQMQN